MKILKTFEFEYNIFENVNNEQSIDFKKYMGGRFPRNMESLNNAPVGSTCDMTSTNSKPLFWNVKGYIWHYLIKRDDGMWEEIEKWDVRKTEHEYVENGVVVNSSDILKAENGSLYMSLPVFDKNGNLLCIPAKSLDQDICTTTKMELLSNIKKYAESSNRTLYGKTWGKGKKAAVMLGNKIWFTRDCEEFANTVTF